ncbi:lysoplasmalogenase [Nocardiopsis sp. CT-R113]|uniref:Lysoplasmalogenase n=1 Tax=Nocardiopsis codii TaxID=3065942 RepID=A0ABU7K8E9_9ACTN|nr:lysoplasmalogenase [Nocardiopsis sp. CT-R113]MEE2037842.1 lysoplasmalogenase [Nocardiopsis sp. CT-R113]
MIPRRPLARALLALYGAVVAVHLCVQWFDADAWSRPTQALLMPVLAAVLLAEAARPGERLTALTAVALGLSWLGDTAPATASGDTAFLLMVGCFLVAQVVYAVAFLPLRADSALHRRRALLVPYAAAVGGLVLACAPGAGGLLLPVLAYGLCLGVAAVLATGVHPLAGAGGALFLVSDGLIALGAFAPGFDLPRDGFWVMLTYAGAQVLLVLGVLARLRARERTAGTAPETVGRA